MLVPGSRPRQEMTHAGQHPGAQQHGQMPRPVGVRGGIEQIHPGARPQRLLHDIQEVHQGGGAEPRARTGDDHRGPESRRGAMRASH
jgi:hypothetical protein